MIINRIKLSCVLLLAILALPGLADSADNYQRSIENYQIPDVTLTNHLGSQVKLVELLDQDKPVLVEFIYATCTTICPILSAGYSNLQRKLGDRSEDVRLLSISIDPEHDNPEVMSNYLKRYRGKPGWEYLTGSRDNIDSVMHAFDAYVSNKMSHYPLTLIKVPEKNQWVRLYGLVGTSELTREIELLYGPVITAEGQK